MARLSIGDFQVEVVGREIAGRPVPGRPRRSCGRYLFGLPALALISLLLVPMACTTVEAFRTGDGLGLANFAILRDPEALHAIGNSFIWIVFVVGALVVVGFAIALVGDRVPWLGRILHPALVLPFALSALVSGTAFRIIFDPAPERGTATALATSISSNGSPVWLGPGWFWIVLVAAFGWTWLGFIVSLFRAGLTTIPDDLGRTVKAEGLGGWRRLFAVEVPILWPIFCLVMLTLVVAAARVFDLVLIALPGSMHDNADVLALHWWRAPSASSDSGQQAVLALALFGIVTIVALLLMRGLRRSWAMPRPVVDQQYRPTRPAPSRNRRLLGLGLALPIGLVWLFPAVVVIATAFHSPYAAGLHGWWTLDGLGFASFAEASSPRLWLALISTMVIAVLATGLVLLVAVPTAYLLAWGGLSRWLGRPVMILFVILAVTPVQMYAAPLGETFAAAGLTGSPISLVFVHAAAGLPLGVLLLRAAFASEQPGPVTEALFGDDRQSAVLTQVRQTYQPVLIAVAVLEFVLVWNDFIIGFLISGPGATPLSLVLWGEARQFATSAGTVAAAAVVSSLVPVVLLSLFWRTVVRGITVGTKP